MEYNNYTTTVSTSCINNIIILSYDIRLLSAPIIICLYIFYSLEFFRK